MKKQDTFDRIESLFDGLSASAQVELLCLLYEELDCAQKDKFLRETGNQ